MPRTKIEGREQGEHVKPPQNRSIVFPEQFKFSYIDLVEKIPIWDVQLHLACLAFSKLNFDWIEFNICSKRIYTNYEHSSLVCS
jgi:hypothetical protein